MRSKARDLAILLTALIVIAGAALYAVKPPATNSVAMAAEGSLQNIIGVNGEAIVTVKPDTVVFTVGVTNQAPTAQKAMADNADKMDAIINAMISAGVKKDDMKTVRFHVGPVYDYKDGGAPKLVGFSASNSLQITQSAATNVGHLIDRAAASGANTIDSIVFTVRDVQKYRDEALTKAMADAKHRAEVLAKSAGVTIKGVRSVVESGSSAPVRAESFDGMRLAAKAMDTQVLSGEMTLTFSVRVEYTF